MIRLGIQFAAGQVNVDLTEGPDAAPSSVSSYTYGGDKIGVQWANGDAEAETQIALTADVDTDPTTNDIKHTASPGTTSWQSGLSANIDANRCAWWCRHARNGQFSDWVSGIHVDGCDSPAGGSGDDGTQL